MRTLGIKFLNEGIEFSLLCRMLAPAGRVASPAATTRLTAWNGETTHAEKRMERRYPTGSREVSPIRHPTGRHSG
jgi:hypothetical protein